MIDRHLELAARTFVWLFFLLICSSFIQMTALKYEIPVRPVFFYGVIASGLFVTATLVSGSLEALKDAKLFFLTYLAIVVLGVVMYRGESFGPDFGRQLLIPAEKPPTSLGYAVWPALNLFAGAGLYLLARREEYQRTIVTAAFVALLIQICSMEADMWWPAIFGDRNGRAGGFAQNANEAALLVTVLASLTLPSVLGDRLNRFAIYAVMLAVAGVLFSQSKAGLICAGVLVACFIAANWRMPLQRPHPVFVAGYVIVILTTIFFSPVLNVTEDQIVERNARHAESAKRKATVDQQKSTDPQSPADPHKPTNDTLGDPNVGDVVTMSERLQSRMSLDTSAQLRVEALAFYADLVKAHPFGMGTGFTNKFVTGPHNAWLKLAVDYGIVAPFLLAVLFGVTTWRAVKARSPTLFFIVATAWISSLFYHTIVVEPLIPVTLAIGLGMLARDAVWAPRAASVQVP